MERTDPLNNLNVLLGYFLSLLGGLLGIAIAINILRKRESELRIHAIFMIIIAILVLFGIFSNIYPYIMIVPYSFFYCIFLGLFIGLALNLESDREKVIGALVMLLFVIAMSILIYFRINLINAGMFLSASLLGAMLGYESREIAQGDKGF